MISNIKYYAQLLKFRLSLTVVISAIAGYLIGITDFNFQEFIFLIFGGFLVTGSANGFNQVLEKDYDKFVPLLEAFQNMINNQIEKIPDDTFQKNYKKKK